MIQGYKQKKRTGKFGLFLRSTHVTFWFACRTPQESRRIELEPRVARHGGPV